MKKRLKTANEEDFMDKLLAIPKNKLKKILEQAMESDFGDVRFITTQSKARKFMEETERDIKKEYNGELPEEYAKPIWNVNSGDDYVVCELETYDLSQPAEYYGLTFDDLIDDLQQGEDNSEYIDYLDMNVLESAIEGREVHNPNSKEIKNIEKTLLEPLGIKRSYGDYYNVWYYDLPKVKSHNLDFYPYCRDLNTKNIIEPDCLDTHYIELLVFTQDTDSYTNISEVLDKKYSINDWMHNYDSILDNLMPKIKDLLERKYPKEYARVFKTSNLIVKRLRKKS